MTHETEIIILDLFKRGLNPNEIGRKLHISPVRTVRPLLKSKGLIAPSGTHFTNHDFFDTLTEHSEYWTGFLFADGHIAKQKNRKPRVQLALNASDKEHLIKFKNDLSATQKISRSFNENKTTGKYSEECRIRITSEQICKKLKEFGMDTPSLMRVSSFELSNSKHFWRGMIDGDGCIGYCNGYPRLTLVGGTKLLEQFNEFCANHNIATSKLYISKGNPEEFRRVIFQGGNMLKLLEILYSQSNISLVRKHKLAIQIIQNSEC